MRSSRVQMLRGHLLFIARLDARLRLHASSIHLSSQKRFYLSSTIEEGQRLYTLCTYRLDIISVCKCHEVYVSISGRVMGVYTSSCTCIRHVCLVLIYSIRKRVDYLQRCGSRPIKSDWDDAFNILTPPEEDAD